MLNIYWDPQNSSEVVEGNTVTNNDGEYRIFIVPKSVEQMNEINFMVNGENFDVMLGVCDRKVRKERGLFLQDKSFVGHGMYLLQTNWKESSIFSHWDMDKNYAPGGFRFNAGEKIHLQCDGEKVILCNDESCASIEIQHHQKKQLFFCAVIARGSVSIV